MAAIPAGLPERVVEEFEVGGGPGGVGQVPVEVVEIPALGVGALQYGVELACEQGGAVVVLELEGDVVADDRCLEDGSGGWAGIHLDLDGELVVRVRAESQLVREPLEADEGTVDGAIGSGTRLDLVPFGAQGPEGGADEALEVVPTFRALQGEVQILGEPRQVEQEPQRGSSVEGERDHRTLSLEVLEDPRLEVLADRVDAVGGQVFLAP